MVVSPPPRVQFAGVPLVWSRLVPLSKVEFTQKLPGSKLTRATDKSSMTITPVMAGSPPEARAQRIVTAPAGTTNAAFRFVNVELAMVPIHPALLVPEVVRWVSPRTLLAALKNCTVKRISGALRLYISYHWIFNTSPLVALPRRLTSERHSPKLALLSMTASE